MSKILYAGSFDPFTKGHKHLVDRAAKVFDGVVIAVFYNPKKDVGMFNLEERMKMIEEIYSGVENIEVVKGEGLTVELAKLYECKAMLRGLRNEEDFKGEIELAQQNTLLSQDIETIAMFSDPKYNLLSSSFVKKVATMGDITNLVDENVKVKVYEKLGK
jgi:pantetheine-phosphate adenylyltransferase, bacterial